MPALEPKALSLGGPLALSRPQFDALVLGLPWERLGDGGVIRMI